MGAKSSLNSRWYLSKINQRSYSKKNPNSELDIAYTIFTIGTLNKAGNFSKELTTHFHTTTYASDDPDRITEEILKFLTLTSERNPQKRHDAISKNFIGFWRSELEVLSSGEITRPSGVNIAEAIWPPPN